MHRDGYKRAAGEGTDTRRMLENAPGRALLVRVPLFFIVMENGRRNWEPKSVGRNGSSVENGIGTLFLLEEREGMGKEWERGESWTSREMCVNK